MTYAQGRTIYDADSHLLELPDFLQRYGDPGMRDQLPDIGFAADTGPKLKFVLDRIIEAGGHSEEHRAEMRALGDAILSGPKGFKALGAFDGSERTEVIDMLGFESQLLFATFSAIVIFDAA